MKYLKYVRRARAWCVSDIGERHLVLTSGKITHNQTQKWFSTKDEAIKEFNKEEE